HFISSPVRWDQTKATGPIIDVDWSLPTDRLMVAAITGAHASYRLLSSPYYAILCARDDRCDFTLQIVPVSNNNRVDPARRCRRESVRVKYPYSTAHKLPKNQLAQ